MGKKKLVLLVDDNEDLGRSYKELLELNLDCCVICYTTGNRAIKDITAGNVSYDLAIIDLSVDTWDGSSLISESREMHPQKPVICFSGWANTRTPEKGIFRIDKSDGLGALVMKIKGLLE